MIQKSKVTATLYAKGVNDLLWRYAIEGEITTKDERSEYLTRRVTHMLLLPKVV